MIKASRCYRIVLEQELTSLIRVLLEEKRKFIIATVLPRYKALHRAVSVEKRKV